MKGGNEFKLWRVLSVAIWISWTVVVQSHATWSTDREADSKFGEPNYPTVRFTLTSSSYDAYREMIARLRELLTSHREYRQGIPTLREPRSVPDTERYILLEISVDGGQAVTFAIDVTNVYVVGYLIGSTRTRYFFEEAPARADQLLFTDATEPSTSTRRSSNYARLENRAGATRTSITLGLPNMEHAIRTLVTRPEDARSLIVVIQMVAEAVRYWEIECLTVRESSFAPNGRMIDFENNWQDLSRQIQISEAFAFQNTINIGEQDVDNVQSSVIRALCIMQFICREEEGRCKDLADTATQVLGRDGLCPLDPRLQMMRSDLEGDDDTCKNPVDPRSQIQGRDGLCMDVAEFIYRDNNPVILFPCRSSDFRNQLWNFQSDGRIVSLEKCLAASGETPGSTVVIHECDTLHGSAVQWQMTEYGTLSNIHSRLVLTAAAGTSKQLTLETDINSSFQAWQSTNTSAVDVYIHGENNQCIYYNSKKGVYTEDCRKDYSYQKWRLYPDSTIRPIEWLDGCMELKSLSSGSGLMNSYNYIQAGKCSSYPEYHRWILTRDGTIMNLKSNLVVDADKDYKQYLKAAPFDGGLNQIWTLEFI